MAQHQQVESQQMAQHQQVYHTDQTENIVPNILSLLSSQLLVARPLFSVSFVTTL